jgi:hypothetical protein
MWREARKGALKDDLIAFSCSLFGSEARALIVSTFQPWFLSAEL